MESVDTLANKSASVNVKTGGEVDDDKELVDQVKANKDFVDHDIRAEDFIRSTNYNSSMPTILEPAITEDASKVGSSDFERSKIFQSGSGGHEQSESIRMTSTPTIIKDALKFDHSKVRSGASI